MNAQSNEVLQQVEETIGQLLMRTLYDEITNMRTLWAVTPQQQQRETLDRLQRQVDQAVHIAVNRIAIGGFSHITAQIESLTIKDEAKAALLLSRGTEALHELADRVGSRAIVVFADPKEFTEGMDSIKAQADQPDLPLEEGGEA
jgi:hypothetical protein